MLWHETYIYPLARDWLALKIRAIAAIAAALSLVMLVAIDVTSLAFTCTRFDGL
jgi:hypothetical protein